MEEYTTTCICPICGGKMTPAEYYVTRMDVSVNVDNSKVFTVAKTTTAQFHNLRRKIGGLCVPCHHEQERKANRTPREVEADNLKEALSGYSEQDRKKALDRSVSR